MTARRFVVLVGLLIATVIVLPLLPPVRTVVLTVALVPEMLGVGVQPLSMAIPAPRRISIDYGTPIDRMDVYLPYGVDERSSRPAVVLALGVHPQPVDHPDIVRLASAISRMGVVVGIPDSTALRELRVTPDEPAHLADAFLVLAARPEVDARRVGLAGFSAGASIALIAATDARIVDQVRFVSAFGGYADAERLLIDVATRTTMVDGEVEPWAPDPGIRRDVLELMLGALDDAAASTHLRQHLAPVVAHDEPPEGPRDEVLAGLTDDARAIYLLFTAPDRLAAEQAIASLSSDLRTHLAGISPLRYADRIHAPVFLLHGESDTAIPVVHASLLADAIGDEVQRLTRFGSFGHEQPGVTGLGMEDLGDVIALTVFLRDIVAAATE